MLSLHSNPLAPTPRQFLFERLAAIIGTMNRAVELADYEMPLRSTQFGFISAAILEKSIVTPGGIR